MALRCKALTLRYATIPFHYIEATCYDLKNGVRYITKLFEDISPLKNLIISINKSFCFPVGNLEVTRSACNFSLVAGSTLRIGLK